MGMGIKLWERERMGKKAIPYTYKANTRNKEFCCCLQKHVKRMCLGHNTQKFVLKQNNHGTDRYLYW